MNKLKVVNLTPHDVMIIDPQAIKQERTGMTYLKDDIDDESAYVITSIPTSGISLTVQEDATIPKSIGPVRLYRQMGDARFDRIIPEEIIRENDIIIVSSKCARLLLVLANNMAVHSQFQPVVPHIESLFDVDRFYTPKCIVHRTVNGKNTPVGALGLQQVASLLPANMYAKEIENSENLECPVSGASCFTAYQNLKSMAKYFGINESTLTDLPILEKYLRKRELVA